ncbi:MAG: hypothetical protein K5866_08890 [Treponema sp.]|nr:hypothetical protein [Treponema sp.]
MKKQLLKAVLTTAVMVFGLHSTLFAYTEYNSPTADSSAGLFSSDSDNIRNVNEWNTVEFDKLFFNVDYNYTLVTLDYIPVLNLVGAFNIGNLLIAPAFTGNVFSSYSSSTSNTSKSYTVNENVVSDYSIQETHSYYVNNSINAWGNDFSALIGFGNMAFKPSFSFCDMSRYGSYYDSTTSQTDNTQTNYNEDGEVVSTITTKYDNGKIISDCYIPGLAFGMNLGLGSMTLKPYVDFRTAIKRTGYKTGKTVTDSSTDGSSEVYKLNYVNGTYSLIPVLGATLEIPGEKFNQAFGVKYYGSFDLYASKFDDAFGNTQKVRNYSGNTSVITEVSDTNTVKTTKQDGTVYSEKSNIENQLTLDYTFEKALSNQFTLMAKAVLIPSYNFTKNKSYKYSSQSEVTTYNDGHTETVETITTGASTLNKTHGIAVSSNIAFGFKYDVKPGKFVLLGGTSITLPNFSCNINLETNPDYSTTSVKESDSYGNVSRDSTDVTYSAQTSKKTFYSYWSTLQAMSSFCGFNWYMTDSFMLEASLELSVAAGVFSKPVNLGCTLKF